MSNLYLTSAELADLRLPDLPKSKQGIEHIARRDQWLFENIPGQARGGKRKVFVVSQLPADIQAAIRAKQTAQLLAETAPAPMPALSDADIKSVAVPLTDRQRQVESARMGVLTTIDNIVGQTGCAKEHAIKTVLTNARMVGFEQLARLFELARDERGATGELPSLRTIKRWFANRDHLAPKIKQADMSLPEWAPLYLKFYQVPQKVSHQHAYEQFAQAFLQTHPMAKLPSPWQCYRFVQKLGNVSKQKGRIGEREIKYLKPYKVREFLHLEPTEIYTCDGHTFDAEVLHPDSGKPFRPEITTIADVATRKIVGFSVDLAESGTAVLAAISHACETNGVPALFYVDNGGGYRNHMMADEAIGLMGRIGTSMVHSLAYSSQARGVIEHLHKTVWVKAAQSLQTYMGELMDPQAKQLVHKTTRGLLKKGMNLKNVPALANIQSLNPNLILDFREFVAFCEWHVAQYNNRPHSSLPKILDVNGKRRHMTPNEMWALKVEQGAQIIKIADDEKYQLFLPQQMRTVQRGCVFLQNNRYFSQSLDEYNGDTVRVAYDIHDANHVWVYDDLGRLICRAEWNGNNIDYMPVSVRDQAKDKRVDAQLRRLGVKQATAEAARPQRYIEHQASSVNMGGITIDMDKLAEQGEKARLSMRQHNDTVDAVVTKEVQKAELIEEQAAWSVPTESADRFALFERIKNQAGLPEQAARWVQMYPNSHEYKAMSKRAHSM